MSHRKMVYKKDYVKNKPSTRWEGDNICCLGQQLKIIDEEGYLVWKCTTIIHKGDEVYFRGDCECKPDEGPFCSVTCGWRTCYSCERKICNTCYSYKETNCVYCTHRGEECDCLDDEYLCGVSEEEEESEEEQQSKEKMREEYARVELQIREIEMEAQDLKVKRKQLKRRLNRLTKKESEAKKQRPNPK